MLKEKKGDSIVDPWVISHPENLMEEVVLRRQLCPLRPHGIFANTLTLAKLAKVRTATLTCPFNNLYPKALSLRS
jgi:hypothetical protein